MLPVLSLFEVQFLSWCLLSISCKLTLERLRWFLPGWRLCGLRHILNPWVQNLCIMFSRLLVSQSAWWICSLCAVFWGNFPGRPWCVRFQSLGSEKLMACCYRWGTLNFPFGGGSGYGSQWVRSRSGRGRSCRCWGVSSCCFLIFSSWVSLLKY